MVTLLFGCVWLIYLEKAIFALKTPGGWDASSTVLWSLYTLYIGHCWFFFIYLADVMPVVGCMLLAMYSKRWFQWIINTAQFIVTCFRNTVSKFDWRFIIHIWEKMCYSCETITLTNVIVNCTLGDIFGWHLNTDTGVSIEENEFQKVVCGHFVFLKNAAMCGMLPKHHGFYSLN